ncbi:MAG: MFS transporter [Bacteroidetes bacterium]|nr:MFS transporter [Bacteroidota bacterium]
MSSTSPSLVHRLPFYYGWMVTAGATVAFGLTIPGQTAGVSLFIDAFIDELGVSRTLVSWLYMGATLLAATFLPAFGRWLDRAGPQRALVAVTLLFGAACAWMGFAAGWVMLALGFVLLRFCGPGALSLVSLHAVNLWFERRRGTAVGILGVGLAVSTALFPLLIEWFITLLGWRGAFFAVGGLLLLLLLPLALVLRDAPERYGLSPSEGEGGAPDRPARPPAPSFTLPEARRTVLFWLLTAGGLHVGAIGTGLLFHHFSIMEAGDLPRTAAAAFFLPFGVVSAGTYVASGYVLDRTSPRKVLGVLLVLFAGVTAFAGQITSPALVIAYGCAFGVTQGTQGTLFGSAYAHYFGRRHHGAVRGFASTMFVAGTALGPPLVALGPALFEGYALLLPLIAVLPAALGLGVLLYRRENPQPWGTPDAAPSTGSDAAPRA